MQASFFVVLIVLIGGLAVGFQGPLSSLMTQRLGPMESVFIIHVGGALGALLPLLARSGGRLGAWASVPWYALLAGLLGVIVISVIGFAIPRLGVASTTVLIVAGQLLVGVLLDQFGLLGAATRPLDAQRALGILVLFAGVWLILH